MAKYVLTFYSNRICFHLPYIGTQQYHHQHGNTDQTRRGFDEDNIGSDTFVYTELLLMIEVWEAVLDIGTRPGEAYHVRREESSGDVLHRYEIYLFVDQYEAVTAVYRMMKTCSSEEKFV